jgi:putative colanic acid biosynthesis acetyltransferase WcaF
VTASPGEHTSVRSLRGFRGMGYEKGRSRLSQALWFAALNMVFVQWWCPAWARVALLRTFGATVGERVFIRHRVRVLWPWKLKVGDDSWIGEDAWILNLEPVRIGSNVCISQGVFLCAGSHDPVSPTFEYDNGPIAVEDEVWLGARTMVLRNVVIGRGAVVPANSRVTRDVPAVSASDQTRRSP